MADADLGAGRGLILEVERPARIGMYRHRGEAGLDAARDERGDVVRQLRTTRFSGGLAVDQVGWDGDESVEPSPPAASG